MRISPLSDLANWLRQWTGWQSRRGEPKRIWRQNIHYHHIKALKGWTVCRACQGKVLLGKPYDGHRLETIQPDSERTRGDAINPILAAAGYNFRPIFNWIAIV